MGRPWKRALGTAIVLAILAACGSEGDTPPLGPDESLAPFVGTWYAEVMTITNDADPSVVADLMLNGVFFIHIEPSGLYTASLEFGGIPLPPEIGQVTILDGGYITLRPNAPGTSPATSAYTFLQPDYLRMVGPTDFDFNLDGTSEPSELFLEVRRR